MRLYINTPSHFSHLSSHVQRATCTAVVSSLVSFFFLHIVSLFHNPLPRDPHRPSPLLLSSTKSSHGPALHLFSSFAAIRVSLKLGSEADIR
ncbi:hypothetical protein BDU57DRAFT_515725 [Ampelomyces quisqualis]|uniref:Uncharacterized protein n=1 Tax=Ampelomyces quisqualis TaxID=50730 RepID=A0A6A5QKE1_AMPQU|nr:hypothetical protein BDU57DRAFT_515725 [Ampelomyces quisqualis]